jgi:hypothetical protein
MSVSDPDYAQHLDDDTAAWLRARHNPKFKPRKPKHAFNSRPTKMNAKRFEEVMRSNILSYGTPRQIAELGGFANATEERWYRRNREAA